MDRTSTFYMLPALHCTAEHPFCVPAVTFLPTSLKHSIDLELEYIVRKSMKHRFQWYIVHTEILSTSHARVEYISGQTIRHSAYSNERGRKCRKIPETAPSPWGTWTHLIHQCLGDPTYHAKWQLDRFTHFTELCNKFPIGYNGMLQICPKAALPFDDNHPCLIHSSLDWPHSWSQTASGSIQPFCHSTLCDRPTDRWSRWMSRNLSTPLAMVIESNALIISW